MKKVLLCWCWNRLVTSIWFQFDHNWPALFSAWQSSDVLCWRYRGWRGNFGVGDIHSKHHRKGRSKRHVERAVWRHICTSPVTTAFRQYHFQRPRCARWLILPVFVHNLLLWIKFLVGIRKWTCSSGVWSKYVPTVWTVRRSKAR